MCYPLRILLCYERVGVPNVLFLQNMSRKTFGEVEAFALAQSLEFSAAQDDLEHFIV